MKAKVNGREKGKSGEREICKIFGMNLGGNWMRVPSSGAMVGGTNKARLSSMSLVQGRAFRGDIIPPDHLTKMYLEVKSYKEFSFHQLLQSQTCMMLDTWIEQCLTGVQDDDQWFICFKITRKGWFIALPHSAASMYKLDSYCVYNSKDTTVVVTNLTSFLANNKDAILSCCC